MHYYYGSYTLHTTRYSVYRIVCTLHNITQKPIISSPCPSPGPCPCPCPKRCAWLIKPKWLINIKNYLHIACPYTMFKIFVWQIWQTIQTHLTSKLKVVKVVSLVKNQPFFKEKNRKNRNISSRHIIVKLGRNPTCLGPERHKNPSHHSHTHHI